MNAFLLFLILLITFLILTLIFFALSSCLGDELRAAWSGGRRNRRPVPTTFGTQYARLMGHGGGQAGWEGIEMQDMLDRSGMDGAEEDDGEGRRR